MLIVLPFSGTFNLNLTTLLYKLFSKSLPQCNLKVSFQSKSWLSSFSKFKDSIPLHLCSHLIYKFQCSNCNITSYDKTERHLKVRAGGHIWTSPLTGKSVNDNKKSSVKYHYLLSGHVFFLIILPSWIMSHTSLNAWLKNLYLLPRINHYWTNVS